MKIAGTLKVNIDKLKMIGAEWIAYDKHRIYFSYKEHLRKALMEYCKIHFLFYNTGNISSAFVNTSISNKKGGQYLQALEGLYYDVKSDKFFHGEGLNKYSHKIIKLIKNWAII